MSRTTTKAIKRKNNKLCDFFSSFQVDSIPIPAAPKRALPSNTYKRPQRRNPKLTKTQRRKLKFLEKQQSSQSPSPSAQASNNFSIADLPKKKLKTGVSEFLMNASLNSFNISTEASSKTNLKFSANPKNHKNLIVEEKKKINLDSDNIDIEQAMKLNYILPAPYIRLLRKFYLMENEVKILFKKSRRISFRKIREKILFESKT